MQLSFEENTIPFVTFDPQRLNEKVYLNLFNINRHTTHKFAKCPQVQITISRGHLFFQSNNDNNFNYQLCAVMWIYFAVMKCFRNWIIIISFSNSFTNDCWLSNLCGEVTFEFVAKNRHLNFLDRILIVVFLMLEVVLIEILWSFDNDVNYTFTIAVDT